MKVTESLLGKILTNTFYLYMEVEGWFVNLANIINRPVRGSCIPAENWNKLCVPFQELVRK